MTIRNVTVLTSPDAVTWTVRNVPWDTQGVGGYKVGWNGSTAVAIGGDSNHLTDTLIIVSTDTAAWAGHTLGYEGIGSGAGTVSCWGGGLGLWAVGWQVGNIPTAYPNPINPTVFTSPTGASWTGHTSPFDVDNDSDDNNEGCYDILFDGSKFVAIGGGATPGGKHSLSTDGLTWALPQDWDGGPSEPSPMTTVAFDGGIYICAGHGLFPFWETSNPTGWTSVPSGYPMDPTHRIRWGDQFVAGGNTTSGLFEAIATSPDGTTWTAISTPWDGNLVNDVAWNGTLWVAVGHGPGPTLVLTSPDAVTWTEQTTPIDATGTLRGITWAPELSLWIAVGIGTIDIAPGSWILG